LRDIIIFNMRSFSLFLLLLPICAFAQIPEGYYSSVTDGQKSEAIYSALHTKINNHQVLKYDDLEDYYEDIDFDENGYLMDIYSTCLLTMEDANKQQSGVCDAWNKEHTIPQSWFSGGGGMKSDLFHVYPTDACVNGTRSNYAYGENASTSLGLKAGKDPDNHGLGSMGSNTFGGYSIGTVYEPDDQFKGDIARNYFYMATCYAYSNFTKSTGAKMFTSTGFTEFALKLLLKWHRQDPVSQKEIDRNNGVYKVQKNRNPFIDYPYLVEYIWGDKKGQAFDWTKIISSENPSFIPGKSNGLAGNDSTGGITTPYHIEWLVDSVPYTEGDPTTQVNPGSSITQLPAKPTSCDERSEQFIGWSQYAIADSTDIMPADLFMELSKAPAITSDVTFYAIFAHVTQTGTRKSNAASVVRTRYSRIISQCTFTVAGIEEIYHSLSPVPCTKFLKNGRLYIVINNKIYTIDGQVIK